VMPDHSSSWLSRRRQSGANSSTAWASSPIEPAGTEVR
jgi:hypothetical protein